MEWSGSDIVCAVIGLIGVLLSILANASAFIYRDTRNREEDKDWASAVVAQFNGKSTNAKQTREFYLFLHAYANYLNNEKKLARMKKVDLEKLWKTYYQEMHPECSELPIPDHPPRDQIKGRALKVLFQHDIFIELTDTELYKQYKEYFKKLKK